MDDKVLREYVSAYKKQTAANPEEYKLAWSERRDRVTWYRTWDKARLLAITSEELEAYLSKLWAMLTWGNKRYYVDLIIEKNSIETVRSNLADLIYGDAPIANRWEQFRDQVSHIGPAMASELLAHHFPESFPVWNRKAKEALERLGEQDLPAYNYQITGAFYDRLIGLTAKVAQALTDEGFRDVDKLVVDYFFWDLLQGFPITAGPTATTVPNQVPSPREQIFVHNEIRDKIAEIGTWLGFKASTEQTITTGTRIDVVWEASIGNMGRVLYAFEVQASGSIDSLQLNLLRSLSNPAVQAVVAVSDERQLDKIRGEAGTLPDLSKKIRYWDFREVLETHASLSTAFDSINRLKLVPDSF
ncbi:MAG TPA: hypothetical protein PKZ09_09370 [Bacillota bacterium]|nr:hypothetical protein [Bacillota bacterium]